jgi:hypothetical protein
MQVPILLINTAVTAHLLITALKFGIVYGKLNKKLQFYKNEAEATSKKAVSKRHST